MERKLAATNFCCYVYELTQVNVTHNRRKCEYITINQQKYLAVDCRLSLNFSISRKLVL